VDNEINDCLIKAFSHFFKDIGKHFPNRQAIQWPDLPRPLCYRGVHIQEIVDVLVKEYETHLVEITYDPYIAPEGYDELAMPVFIDAANRFWHRVQDKSGVIIGKYKKGKYFHAVCWDCNKLFEASSLDILINPSDFNIREFWMILT
jgi:hypothetical protein